MKPIVGYDNYFITETPEVFRKNKSDGRIKKVNGTINNAGYIMIGLSKNGITTLISLHRLAGKHFIVNPENKPCINHINGIKTDNRIENLEWCTYKENTAHGWKTGLIKPAYGMLGKIASQNKKSIPIKQIDKKTNEVIKVWDSMACPRRKYGWITANIHACIIGKRPSAHGYKWEYA